MTIEEALEQKKAEDARLIALGRRAETLLASDRPSAALLNALHNGWSEPTQGTACSVWSWLRGQLLDESPVRGSLATGGVMGKEEDDDEALRQAIERQGQAEEDVYGR